MSSDIEVAGRRLTPSPAFGAFWSSAAERQAIYMRRLAGWAPPLTCDPVFLEYKFTNVFRASDRVSQYLIRNVIYSGDQRPEEVTFRTLLFKLFNRISTWKLLEDHLGGIVSWHDYDFGLYNRIFDDAKSDKIPLYTSAYLMVARPPYGEQTQHGNHLRLVERMMHDDLLGRITSVPTMEGAYEIIKSYPSVGKFLAYQLLIDLNYGPHLNFSEMEFVVSGPGCDSGLHKMFGAASRGIEADIIRWMALNQHWYFSHYGPPFSALFGRPMQLIDVEHWTCETDKYARVACPDIPGLGGRAQVKARWEQSDKPVTAWYPPKWGINGTIVT